MTLVRVSAVVVLAIISIVLPLASAISASKLDENDWKRIAYSSIALAVPTKSPTGPLIDYQLPILGF